jgi:hypothetical protein
MVWSKEDWYEIDEVLQDFAHLLDKMEKEERRQERKKQQKIIQPHILEDINGDKSDKSGR